MHIVYVIPMYQWRGLARRCGHGGGGRGRGGRVHGVPPGAAGARRGAGGQAGAHLGQHLARRRPHHRLPPHAQRQEGPLGQHQPLQPGL